MKKRWLNVVALTALIALGGVATTGLVGCGDNAEEESTTKHTVSYATSSDYTISIASGTEYSEGATVTFTVTPASGKVIKSVTVNGTPLTGSGTYSFNMPKTDVTIIVEVDDEATTTYSFTVELGGEYFVGNTLTTTGYINNTAYNDYTIKATAGADLVSIDNDTRTVELLEAGDVTLEFSATYEGQTLTYTEDIEIIDTAGGYDVLFTIDPTTTTNLQGMISSNSTYKKKGECSDTINGVTINYTDSTNLGIANPKYAGYSELGVFQGRSSSKSETFFSSTEILEVSKIEICYYNTYKTFDNFLEISIGNTTVSEPSLISMDATGVMYENSEGKEYEINKFTYEYYFGEDAVGTLAISGSTYTSYFNNIKVYGELGTLPDPTGISLEAEKDEIAVGETTKLIATTTPVSSSGTISYNIVSGEEYIELDGDTVRGVAAGTALVNATITYGDNKTITSSSVEITVTSGSIYDGAEKVTVSQLLQKDGTADLNENTDTVIYELTGILTQSESDDSYGNAYLVDKETGEEVKVYGTAKLGTGFTYEEGTWKFSNPRNWPTVVEENELENGDEVTLYVIYGLFGSTPEVLGEFKEVATRKEEISTYKLDSTLPEYLTISKSTGYTYGEEVTLTVDPEKLPEGKVIGEIRHNSSGLSSSDGVTYKFNAEVKNEITVTLRDEGSAINLTITSSDLGLGGYGDNTTGVHLNGATIKWVQLMNGDGGTIQANNSKKSYIYGSADSGYKITKIILDIDSSSNPKAETIVTFGTSELGSYITSGGTSITGEEGVVTFDSDVENATHFNISRPVGGATYFNSITLVLEAAE